VGPAAPLEQPLKGFGPIEVLPLKAIA
jgi:hypothetical protein